MPIGEKLRNVYRGLPVISDWVNIDSSSTPGVQNVFYLDGKYAFLRRVCLSVCLSARISQKRFKNGDFQILSPPPFFNQSKKIPTVFDTRPKYLKSLGPDF